MFWIYNSWKEQLGKKSSHCCSSLGNIYLVLLFAFTASVTSSYARYGMGWSSIRSLPISPARVERVDVRTTDVIFERVTSQNFVAFWCASWSIAFVSFPKIKTPTQFVFWLASLVNFPVSQWPCVVLSIVVEICMIEDQKFCWMPEVSLDSRGSRRKELFDL